MSDSEANHQKTPPLSQGPSHKRPFSTVELSSPHHEVQAGSHLGRNDAENAKTGLDGYGNVGPSCGGVVHDISSKEIGKDIQDITSHEDRVNLVQDIISSMELTVECKYYLVDPRWWQLFIDYFQEDNSEGDDKASSSSIDLCSSAIPPLVLASSSNPRSITANRLSSGSSISINSSSNSSISINVNNNACINNNRGSNISAAITIPKSVFNLLSTWYGLDDNSVALSNKPFPVVNMKTHQTPDLRVYTKPVVSVENFTLGFKSELSSKTKGIVTAMAISVMNLASQMGVKRQWKLWQIENPKHIYPPELKAHRFAVIKDKKLIATSSSVAPSATLESILAFPPVMKKDSNNVYKTVQLVIEEITERGWLSADDGKTRGTVGLQNLGNTCYMNSALQCLAHIEELAAYFLSGRYEKDINTDNPIGYGGNVAIAFGKLVRNLFYGTSRPYSPSDFRYTIGRYNSAFSGYMQQDSQEFLAFLLDSLHEDLNRIKQKPATEKPELAEEKLNDEQAINSLAQECWKLYKMRNDSVILDLFTGLYRSTLVCPVCKKISITFDPFMDLTLPIPNDNLWFKDIYVVRANGKLQEIKVAINKFSTIWQLKEYLCQKLDGLSPSKLICSEVYNNRFYMHHDNRSIVSEHIQLTDTIMMNELVDDLPDEVFRDNSGKEGEAKNFLVPIFHRSSPTASKELSEGTSSRYESGGHFLGCPFFLLLTPEEASDYELLKCKVMKRCRNIVPSLSDNEIILNFAVQRRGRGFDTNSNSVMTGWGLTKENIKPLAMRLPRDSSLKSDLDKLEQPLMQKINKQQEDDDRNKVEDDFSSVSSGGFIDISSDIPIGASVNIATDVPTPDTSSLGVPSSIASSSRPSPIIASMEIDAESEDSGSTNDLIEPLGSLPASPWSNINNSRFNNDSEGNMTDDDQERSHRHVDVGLLVRPGEGLVIDWKEQPDSDAWVFEKISNPEVVRLRESQQKKRIIPLDECLDLFSKSEVLGENDLWFCSRCQELRQATKTIEFWTVPDILTIHLKRFSSSRNFSDKINETIEFPIENLDMSKRVGSGSRSEPLIYDLIGVDNHFGRLGGGHYTAHAKNFVDGKWYYFDDTSCTGENPEKVVSDAAYLLFYRRRSSKPLGGEVLAESIKSMRQTMASGESNDSDSEYDSDSVTVMRNSNSYDYCTNINYNHNDNENEKDNKQQNELRTLGVVVQKEKEYGRVLGRGTSSTSGPSWATSQLNLDDDDEDDEVIVKVNIISNNNGSDDREESDNSSVRDI